MNETKIRYVIQNEKGEYAFAGLYEIYWHKQLFNDHNLIDYPTKEKAQEAFPNRKVVKLSTSFELLEE